MATYRLSNLAKEDLIRIHKYGVKNYGITLADKYFDSLFENFDIIAQNPFYFESAHYIKAGYRRYVSGSDSIYYTVNIDNVVEIMAIIGKQDLKNIL